MTQGVALKPPTLICLTTKELRQRENSISSGNGPRFGQVLTCELQLVTFVQSSNVAHEQ